MMERSWLIQRLQSPSRTGQIFRFDYMGAAEFEWGAVPAALRKITKNAKKYRASTVDVDGSTIYVICHRDDVAEVAARIRGWATEQYSHLKEQTWLWQTLNDPHDASRAVCGWLELDNGFFFFTDAVMFRATADGFGVKVKAAVA